MQERKVIGGVVSESGKFGDLESGKTAQQQSDQRGEDELCSHYKALIRKGDLYSTRAAQLNCNNGV